MNKPVVCDCGIPHVAQRDDGEVAAHPRLEMKRVVLHDHVGNRPEVHLNHQQERTYTYTTRIFPGGLIISYFYKIEFIYTVRLSMCEFFVTRVTFWKNPGHQYTMAMDNFFSSIQERKTSR